MSLQQRQLVGLSASSLLLLLLLSSHAANPALCARGGSFGLHPPLHQTRRSHAHDRSHISNGFNPLVRTPGAHIQTPTFATSMKPTTNSLDDNEDEDVVPTRPNSGTGRSIALSKPIRRVLIEPFSKSNNVAVESGEDLIFSLAGFKASKDHNLFSMLPRAHRVPPSGPSKSHNSALTEKSS